MVCAALQQRHTETNLYNNNHTSTSYFVYVDMTVFCKIVIIIHNRSARPQ